MIPDWFSDHSPLYDISKTHLENANLGPFFDGPIPNRRLPSKPIDFLGLSLHSPIGIHSGPLFNSRWIALASHLGFDLLTYRTIRSAAHLSSPFPNLLYVERIADHRVRTVFDSPFSIADLTVASSFGTPSQAPDLLMQDIEKAARLLKKGQQMIVSVAGTERSDRNLLEDLIYTALLAKDAGAKIIEADFSHPPFDKVSTDGVFEYTKKLTQALGDTPLLLKMGPFSDRILMEDVFIAAARAGARGISGLYSLKMEVVDRHGHPAFGPDREKACICGSQIRAAALHFMRDAAAINASSELDLVLLGGGGITMSDHFDSFFEAGASIAMAGCGFFWDPYLAMKYSSQHK